MLEQFALLKENLLVTGYDEVGDGEDDDEEEVIYESMTKTNTITRGELLREKEPTVFSQKLPFIPTKRFLILNPQLTSIVICNKCTTISKCVE